MADTKITDLAAAASLADANVLAGVQSTTNKKFALSDLKTYCRSRADATVEGNYSGTAILAGSFHGAHPVRSKSTVGTWYAFFVSANNQDFFFTKTTNYGVTWATPTLIKAGTVVGFAVHADWETPGDTGDKIHVAYMETGGNDVLYNAINTASSDALVGELTVFNGASISAGAGTCLDITKAKGGLIHVVFDIDGGTEDGHYKADANPPTAFATADGSGAFTEGAVSDYYLLFPAPLAATEDIWAVFWDRSANGVTLKTYDDSASSWSEATIIADAGATDLAASTALPQFSGSCRASDGHLILAVWENADTNAAKLRVFDIASAASITEKTNVVTSSTDDQAMCAVGIDSTGSVIYVFYAGSTDGADTAYTSLGIYYKSSSDGGTTWGAETAVSSADRAVTELWCAPNFSAGDYVVMWGGAEQAGATHHIYRCSALR